MKSNWLTTPSARVIAQRARVTGSRIARAAHRPGRAHAYKLPEYGSTGDALLDGVRASVARDTLVLLESLNSV